MTATKKTTKKTESMATETVEAAISAGKEAAKTIENTIDTAVKHSAKATSESLEKAVAVSKEHVEAAAKASADVFKGYEDVIAYNKNNMEALMEVSAIWFKGVQDINNEVTALANTSFEQGVTATQQILGCKTVEEVFTVQSDLAKTNYDKAVAESRKISEMGIKLAEKTAAPIAVRVNETVANFSKPLAA